MQKPRPQIERLALGLLRAVADVSRVAAMVIGVANDRIRSATKDCLTRCYAGDTPLGTIAEFTCELRAAGWNESEIRHVETAVRRILAGLMSIEEATENEEEG